MKNKVFLVTGASSGIGRSVAVKLALKGARLVLAGRNSEELENTRTFLENPAEHETFSCDFTDGSAASKLVGEIASRFERLDGFVHCAGICSVVPSSMFDRRLALPSMAVNCFAFQEIMALLLRSKLAQEGFSAVAVSSVSATSAWKGGGVYCASKAALSAAVRTMALELAPRKIRVNCVSPSNVKTEMLKNLINHKSESEIAALESLQPLGFAFPDQIAGPVVFLLSDEASFVTGADLPVDGGFLAGK